MKTVLIIGAGATRAAAATRSRRNSPPLDADFFEIARLRAPGQYRRVRECLHGLVGDYADTLCGSLETATTYLYIKAIDSRKGSVYHEGFLDLLSLLARVLAETTNELKTGPRTLIYRFLLSELKKCESPDDLTIITFNYDLLLERVLSEIASHQDPGTFNFPGCYRLPDSASVAAVARTPTIGESRKEHSGISLLKLHGSMNWQSLHTSAAPTPAAMFNPNRELHVLNSSLIRAQLSWRRKRRRVHMKPVLVPPISGKRGMMHRELTGVWDSAAQALSGAERVVVAGYSCPPLDLEARILLSENLRSNEAKRLYVIDPNPGTAARFFDLCGVDHVTTYTSIKNWVRDAVPGT